VEERLMEPGDGEVHEEVLEGHTSRLRRLGEKWLLTVVVVLALIAAGSIATALHYRASAASAGKASAAAPAVPLQFRGAGHFTRSLTVANSSFRSGPGSTACSRSSTPRWVMRVRS
jgi:predicted aspartyl protease